MKKILSFFIMVVIYGVLWLPMFVWEMMTIPANKEMQ
jgi:hypothetical protein